MSCTSSLRLLAVRSFHSVLSSAITHPANVPHRPSLVASSITRIATSNLSTIPSKRTSGSISSHENSALEHEPTSVSATNPEYKHILTSYQQKKGVGLITINRPKQLNALNSQLIVELNDALRRYNQDNEIGAVVITGSDKAFAAGADIKEMSDLTFSDAYSTDFIEAWSHQTSQIKKPIIAAVNGFALGGGCELAMMADIIYCNADATFGQPEINLGIVPGAGGSQRLSRAIGKSRAMELILTGKNFSGKEAGDWGLAARVFLTTEDCLEGALTTAAKIASKSRIAVKAAKEIVNKSQDLGIREGVEYERRVFHSLFGSRDQKIGMKAFLEKNKSPEWTNK